MLGSSQDKAKDPGMEQLRQRSEEGESACRVTLPQAYVSPDVWGRAEGVEENYLERKPRRLSLLSIAGLQPHVPRSVVP